MTSMKRLLSLALALAVALSPVPMQAQTVTINPTQFASLNELETLLTALGVNTDGIEALIGTTNTTLSTISGNVIDVEALLTTIVGDTTDIETAIELLDNAAGITPSDNFANPTGALVVYALTGCWDGSTWDRCTGSSADTELPAAAALADNTANPTVPAVAAYLMAFDGTTWDRAQLASDNAQGSTTSGQTGPLVQGAVTTAAPSYTTAQTSPLSLTTGGLLRVAIEAGGGSGGTSSSFGSSYPATGTAFGLSDGTNMVAALATTTQADNLANTLDGLNTTTFLYGFDGSTWDRVLATGGALHVTDGTGALNVIIDSSATLTVNAHAVTNAGTFAVQVDGAALTALQLIDNIVATLGTATYTEATTNGAVMGAVRRDADTTLVDTTNEIGPLQMDANGRLKVEAFSGETLPVSLASVPSHAVTNAGTFAVQVDGAALTALQLIDDTIFADEAAFTYATSKVQAFGAVAESTTDAIADGAIGAPVMTLLRILRTTPTASLSGGAVPVPYISAGATEDEHAVCTGPCNLYSITVTNVNAAVRYLKCENDTAAGTAPGTDTPEYRMAIPGATTGAGFTATFPVGKEFTTALTCWLVTGVADSDVAEVAANEIMVNYDIKQ